MLPKLSSYPSTREGVKDLIQDLTPAIIDLWKVEREERTDDLVAVIDTQLNSVQLHARKNVCAKLKKHTPDIDILKRLTRPASKADGTVRIWGIIGFPNGRVCAVPLVVARS